MAKIQASSTPKVVFSHGKESGPWGQKINYLAKIAQCHGFAVESLDYQGVYNPQDRINKLLLHRPVGQPLILVGSSMGGYVAAMACQELQPQALLLMAPALYLPGYPGDPKNCPKNTAVVHGWQDDIVPVAGSIRFCRARQAALHIVDDGHRLSRSLQVIGDVFARQLKDCLHKP